MTDQLVAYMVVTIASECGLEIINMSHDAYHFYVTIQGLDNQYGCQWDSVEPQQFQDLLYRSFARLSEQLR